MDLLWALVGGRDFCYKDFERMDTKPTKDRIATLDGKLKAAATASGVPLYRVQGLDED